MIDDELESANKSENLSKAGPKAAPSSFKEAFAAARGSGDKIFSYNGKLYTTELASSAPKKTSPAPMRQEKAAPMSSSMGSDLDNASSMPVNERIKKSLESAREGSGPTDTRSVNQRIKQSLEEEKNKTTASSSKDNKIDLRSPATALRSLMSSRQPTDNRSVNERIKESLGMKKGGAVKKMASGGSVNSASKRGDGIAQRGKTKGRMC